MHNNPIGIFDSGLGGLTVTQEICKLLPNEHLIYYGDTARSPWGDQSPNSIRQYVTEITEFLLSRNCKAIVVACNTASSIALDAVINTARRHNPLLPIIQVIEPIIDYIAQNTPANSHLGVIGTHQTILSATYQNKLQQLPLNLKITARATPLLCPVIEAGLYTNTTMTDIIFNHYFSETEFHGINTLILACTHYPLLREQLSNFFMNKVEVLDCATVTAEFLKTVLINSNLINQKSNLTPERKFYLSQNNIYFEELAHRFFQAKTELINVN